MISISSFWTSGLTNERVLASICLFWGCPQNEASGGWQEGAFAGTQFVMVERLQDLAAPCHQDRAERGQLERTSPEMAGLQGDCGDKLCGMVPSGSDMQAP